jgi:hypothetical protein
VNILTERRAVDLFVNPPMFFDPPHIIQSIYPFCYVKPVFQEHNDYDYIQKAPQYGCNGVEKFGTLFACSQERAWQPI